MKFVIALFLTLPAPCTNSQEHPLANVKPLLPSFTYVAIYHYSSSQNEDLFSRKKVFLFNNDELKGSPLYEINNENIIDYTTAEKKNFTYKDYFHYDKKSVSVSIKDMPIDFIRAGINGYYIGISEYNNDIATVMANGKKLYFKISLRNLLGDEVTYIKWPTERNSAKIKDFYSKEMKSNASLEKIVNSIQNCSEEKNSSCLKKALEDMGAGFPVETYNQLKVNHFFANDKNNGCEKNQRELMNTESSLYKKEYPEYIPWDFIKKSVMLEQGQISLERTVKKMINREIVSVTVTGKPVCLAEEKLQMLLEKDLVSNKWKLISFNFADFLSED